MKWGLALVVMILINGCASVRHGPDATALMADHASWQPLADSLAALGREVQPGEAVWLAACAYDCARSLAIEYHAVRPAACQNVMVNLGLKKRGLCYHWAEDMNSRLQELNLHTLEIHWAVARGGTWREHNSLVICARGQPFEQGIVLDAWRYAGRLYWGPVAEDRYPWRPESDDLRSR